MVRVGEHTRVDAVATTCRDRDDWGTHRVNGAADHTLAFPPVEIWVDA